MHRNEVKFMKPQRIVSEDIEQEDNMEYHNRYMIKPSFQRNTIDKDLQFTRSAAVNSLTSQPLI